MVAYSFGCFRYLNQVNGHKVDFDSLSPYRFISVHNWELDREKLLQEYSMLAGISPADVDSAIASTCPVANEWNLAQGHDCLRILAQGLKNVIGAKHLSEQDLARMLRLSYEARNLEASSMYIELLAIEAALGQSILKK